MQNGKLVPRAYNMSADDTTHPVPSDESTVSSEELSCSQAVHMQRHTVGMRGNATSFPMPWLEILRMLKNVDEPLQSGVQPDLPNSGEDLVRNAIMELVVELYS